MKSENVRFGDIKRDERFWYCGKEWVRTRGRSALPVSYIGTGRVGIFLDIETVVTPMKDLKCLYCSNQAALAESIIGRCCEACLAAAEVEWKL